MLYCLCIIGHDWRRILHFNVAKHPTSAWVVQQLRQAFPFDSAPRFLIFDRDAKFGQEVPTAVRSMIINPIQTSYDSQSAGFKVPVAINHVIPIIERHLKRLLSDYVHYYHEDRTHLGLAKQTPAQRVYSSDRHCDRKAKTRRSASPLRRRRVNSPHFEHWHVLLSEMSASVPSHACIPSPTTLKKNS